MAAPIYLDYNASAPLNAAAAEAMTAWTAAGSAGNPSSAHAAGRAARREIERARRQIAAAVGCDTREVVFTSGATEANNLALTSCWRTAARSPSRNRLIVSATEHPAVMEPARALEAAGAALTIIPVKPSGDLDLEALKEALGPDVFLVSMMAVNNETGCIHDVANLAAAAHQIGALFHCDAAQAPHRLALDLAAWDVDLASLSGHKAGGPQGIGALVVRDSAEVVPLFTGGAQQGGRRPGTEPVALCAGMGAAFQALHEAPDGSSTPWGMAAERLRQRLHELPQVRSNGVATRQAQGVFSLTFPGVDAEILVIQLDRRKIYVSTGSACASGAREPSPVLLAMGLTEAEARSTLRVSMGPGTLPAHADALVEGLKAALTQIAAARSES